MFRRRITRERGDPQHLRFFPNQNLVFMYYMISAWWFYLPVGLVHYVIQPGSVEQVIVMSNNLMAFGYTNVKLSIKRPSNIVCTLTHVYWLST